LSLYLSHKFLKRIDQTDLQVRRIRNDSFLSYLCQRTFCAQHGVNAERADIYTYQPPTFKMNLFANF
jgi:hypothetical protein